jgi:hypothetical protein
MAYPTKEDIYLLDGEVTRVIEFRDKEGPYLASEDLSAVTSYDADQWQPFVHNISRFEDYQGLNLEEILNLLAGAPDYSVAVLVCPWPDGGWLASYAVMDALNTKEQQLLGLYLKTGVFSNMECL